MDEIVERSTARSDFNMILLTTFAVSALMLAAIGIYGLMAYSVQQRTQEIGIRVALGAGSHTVRNMIIRQGVGFAPLGRATAVGSGEALTNTIASCAVRPTRNEAMTRVSVPLV